MWKQAEFIKRKAVPMTNEEIATTLATHDNRIKGSEHRIDDLEESQKQIYDLTISVKELAMSVKSMVEEQKQQGERINKLEEKPAKRWDLIITTTITGIISALVGAAMSALFLM